MPRDIATRPSAPRYTFSSAAVVQNADQNTIYACHSITFPQASTTALSTMSFGGTPSSRMILSSCSADWASSALAQAVIAEAKHCWFGLHPRRQDKVAEGNGWGTGLKERPGLRKGSRENINLMACSRMAPIHFSTRTTRRRKKLRKKSRHHNHQYLGPSRRISSIRARAFSCARVGLASGAAAAIGFSPPCPPPSQAGQNHA